MKRMPVIAIRAVIFYGYNDHCEIILRPKWRKILESMEEPYYIIPKGKTTVSIRGLPSCKFVKEERPRRMTSLPSKFSALSMIKKFKFLSLKDKAKFKLIM